MQTAQDQTIVITVTQAANLLGISRPTMYELTERKDFNALVRIGKRKLILLSHFYKWLEKQANNSQVDSV